MIRQGPNADSCRSTFGPATVCTHVSRNERFAKHWHATSFEELNAMPFRISEECPAGTPATYRLAGRLAGDAVAVLVDACVGIAAGAIIDLAEVSYADDAGVSALAELRTRGAVLQGSRPYLTLLLQEATGGR